MEARERENDLRRARGGRLLPMPAAWAERPRLHEAERRLFDEFLRFARFCGGDPRPSDAVGWFDMRGIAQGEREWLGDVFGAMAGVLRERITDG